MICQKHFSEGPEELELYSSVGRQRHRCAQQHQNQRDTLALYMYTHTHTGCTVSWYLAGFTMFKVTFSAKKKEGVGGIADGLSCYGTSRVKETTKKRLGGDQCDNGEE